MPKTTKERLDLLLVEKGLAASRSEARGAIMAGLVIVDGLLVDKPGQRVRSDVNIELRGRPRPYVSRGGEKLAGAHACFGFSVDGRVCLDCGASTGGFTDFLIQNGASRVYAVDVGYGQLAWSLRQDERVVVIERTNARNLVPDDLGSPLPDLAVMDLSFISLSKVITAVEACLDESCQVVALLKPQFEAGRERIGSGGVVRSQSVHRQVLEDFLAFTDDSSSLKVTALTFSPLKGPKGNIEFFLLLERGKFLSNKSAVKAGEVAGVVSLAHASLGAGQRRTH